MRVVCGGSLSITWSINKFTCPIAAPSATHTSYTWYPFIIQTTSSLVDYQIIDRWSLHTIIIYNLRALLNPIDSQISRICIPICIMLTSLAMRICTRTWMIDESCSKFNLLNITAALTDRSWSDRHFICAKSRTNSTARDATSALNSNLMGFLDHQKNVPYDDKHIAHYERTEPFIKFQHCACNCANMAF